jgi:hypothetical protein
MELEMNMLCGFIYNYYGYTEEGRLKYLNALNVIIDNLVDS